MFDSPDGVVIRLSEESNFLLSGESGDMNRCDVA